VPFWRLLEASGVPAVTAGWPLAEAGPERAGRILEERERPPGVHPIDADRTLRTDFDAAIAAQDVQVAAIRYAALSAEGSEALSRMAGPSGRRTLDETYDFVDGEVGRLLGRLAPDDLLLVVSGYRLESPSPFVRLRDRLLDDAGLAVEASRSDGFMLAYGRRVSPGRKTVGAIVDVLPTVLYYLGLPVARDMDGFARTDLFTATLTNERPVSFIRSYQ
jgi:hypothetical protein